MNNAKYVFYSKPNTELTSENTDSLNGVLFLKKIRRKFAVFDYSWGDEYCR